MSPAVAYLQKYRFYILRDEFILSVGVVSVDFLSRGYQNFIPAVTFLPSVAGQVELFCVGDN